MTRMATSTSSAGISALSSSGSDNSEILDLKDDEGWEDVEPEEQQEKIISLLDEEAFPDVASMLTHCRERHNFDFLKIRDSLELDFYGCIRLVNYVRFETKNGRSVSSDISLADFGTDSFLKPVMEDDALLFNLDDLPGVDTKPGDIPAASTLIANGSTKILERVAELEEELRRTQSQFSDYRDNVMETLDRRWNELPHSTDENALKEVAKDKVEDDSYYFDSYSYNDIHETMLKDTVRTDAYRDFIYNHKHLFSGKVVLDVGCGSGILSLFCAKAGAARVIAVDNSAIIDKATENIYNNGYSDKIVCLRGKVEEVCLPVEKVDIIVSEWMGYFLLYEAMLDSILWARDNYLKQGGLMVPSHMNMWIAPLFDPDYVLDHISFWRDVYGFDMKAMQAGIYDDAQVLHMPREALCADPFPFLQLDLYSTTTKDLAFQRDWKCTLSKDIDALDGFSIWFDTFFMPSRDDRVPDSARAEEWCKREGKGIAFTTGPGGKETHWRQGVLFVDNTKDKFSYKKGEVIGGKVEYAIPDGNSRALDLRVCWGSTTGTRVNSQLWKMR